MTTQGFEKEPGLLTQYSWPDRGDAGPTEKTMQYWIKKI